MQSPTAHTPSSPVRQASSTTMKPGRRPRPRCRPGPGRGGGLAADGDDDDLGLDRSPPPGGRRCRRRGSWPVTRTPVRTSMPLLEGALHDLGASLSTPGGSWAGLEDRHLGAEVAHHRGELAADGTAADDDRRARHLGHRQHLVGGHDDAPVDLEARKGPGLRAGGDDDRVGGEGDLLAAVVGIDGHGAPGVQPAVAVVDGDLAALQQHADAGDEPVDEACLGPRGGPVDPPPARTPKSPAEATVRKTCAVSQLLCGMHPTLRCRRASASRRV